MTLLNGSSFIYSTSSVNAIDSIAKARGMTHQTVKSFFKVNGRELSAHNRQFSSKINFKVKDKVLASGNSRRYMIRTPEAYTLSYKYLPGPSAMTVDGQQARDFMFNLANLGQNVTIEYLPDYTSDQNDFDYKSIRARIKTYQESLIRRDENSGCYYYNVTIAFEEL
tara:strand:+ start:765 stop:1265 length:501 start_codon:yes stop_codon:yes gene_type:complete